MLTGKGLAEFCLEKADEKSAYMWGDYGRTITEETINRKSNQYPGRYTKKRQKYLRSLIGKDYIGCDCVGLYKWYLWTKGGTEKLRYNSSTDRNTGGMYSAAKEKGSISTLPEIQGLILYKKGHVGVYVGNGNCVECTLGSFGDGIVKTKVKDRGWTHWLKMGDISYPTEPSLKTASTSYSLALRSVPSTVKGKRYFYIPKGQRVTILEENVKFSDGYEWDNVRYRGTEGYSANMYLNKDPVLKTKKTTAPLALRSMPTTQDGFRYLYIPRGKEVEIIGENVAIAQGYKWDHIVYKGTVGFSANKYLK